VVSSPSGAAVHDILHVLARRFPATEVVIYPAAVQGDRAADELIAALQLALARREADVLIVGRGGGSEEDLAVFNNERLARAIAASDIPVISAVGHETDFTIADFVADRRAPTPSAAAELATPDGAALAQRFRQLGERIRQLHRRRLSEARTRLLQLRHRLERVSPGSRLVQQQQRLDELQMRQQRAMRQTLLGRRRDLRHWQERLRITHPQRGIEVLRSRLAQLGRRLHTDAERGLEQRRQRLQALVRAMQAVSPLATLERGYSIVFSADGGELVRDAAQVKAGDGLEIRLARGRIGATVKSSG
jgi:exodeoxyribonuclease VII large subunit